MTDTIRTLSALQTLLADNSSRAISPQDHRDSLYSSLGALPFGTLAASGTLTEDDCVVSVTCGTVNTSVHLPSALTTRVGKFYVLRKADGSAGGTLTVDPSGTQTANGASTKSITTQYNSLVLINTGGLDWAAFTLTGS